jgi:capsular polysaccharide biosynthesis protein
MELRQYLSIIPRRWPIIVFATAVALIVAVAFALRGPRAYESTVRLAVSLGGDAGLSQAAPDPSAIGAALPPTLPQGARALPENPPYLWFRDYYYWLAAEYLADDLSEVIKSDSFIADVGATLNEDTRRVLVREVLRTKKTHRIIEVTVQAPQAEQAERIALGINRVIQEHGRKYLGTLDTPSGQIAVLDKPVVRPASTTGSLIADLVIRTLAGFVIGLFLAVVAEYFDSTMRTAQEAERALGLPILGQIPEAAR